VWPGTLTALHVVLERAKRNTAPQGPRRARPGITVTPDTQRAGNGKCERSLVREIGEPAGQKRTLTMKDQQSRPARHLTTRRTDNTFGVTPPQHGSRASAARQRWPDGRRHALIPIAKKEVEIKDKKGRERKMSNENTADSLGGRRAKQDTYEPRHNAPSSGRQGPADIREVRCES